MDAIHVALTGLIELIESRHDLHAVFTVKDSSEFALARSVIGRKTPIEVSEGAIPSISQKMEKLQVIGVSSTDELTPVAHSYYLDQLEKIVADRRSVAQGLPTSKDVTMRRFDEDRIEQDISTITAAGELLTGDVLGAANDYKEDYETLLKLREIAERRLHQLIENTPEQNK